MKHLLICHEFWMGHLMGWYEILLVESYVTKAFDSNIGKRRVSNEIGSWITFVVVGFG